MAKKASLWAPFVGRDVRIVWKDERNDWHTFNVLSCAGNKARLVGIYDPDLDVPHVGDVVECEWSEIYTISLMNGDDSYKELIENAGVLDKAREIVDSRDKQEHYGPPEEFMGRLAKMWSGYLGSRLSGDLMPTDAAMMMALLKAARLSTNPQHEDSLVDFAGYAHIYARLK